MHEHSVTPLTSVVVAAQQGDKEAFDQLVVRFQDMAYASAYAILGDPHLAQDAAQEAFLDAYQNLENLREPAAFPGWFRRIVFGRSHRQVRSMTPTSLSFDALTELDFGNLNSMRDPGEVVHQMDVAQQVQEAIAALPPNLRMSLALYYIEGYSQKEIAAYLETPVSTIKKRLFDARQQLKGHLQGELKEERMIRRVQEQLQTNRPSQNDDFARRVQFFTALLAGEWRQIEELLRRDRSLLTAVVEWKMALRHGYWPLGSTALHLAVGRGDRAATELLLSYGAPVDALNVGDMTPLHLAALMRRSELAGYLLEQGAKVDARSKARQTPLHLAARRGDTEMIELLLVHHADVNAIDREGHTPADLAALRHDLQTVDLLVALGAARPQLHVPPRPALCAQPDSPILITGIKAIDLMAPLARGGLIGHFTPLAGVGLSVLLAQYVSGLIEIYDGAAIYLGLESYDGFGEGLQLGWQELGINNHITYLFGSLQDSHATRMDLLEKGLAVAKAHRHAGRETLLLVDSKLASTPGLMPHLRANVTPPPAMITTIIHGHHTVGLLPSVLADLSTTITFNSSLARQRLYPATDPIRSTSTLFTNQLAGSLHAQVATAARELLQRYMDISPVVEAGGVEALWYIDDDPLVLQSVARARRLQRFLTQPFYGAEPWSGLIGQLIPLEETIKGCQAILAGEGDALPEEAFTFVGTFNDARAKAQHELPV